MSLDLSSVLTTIRQRQVSITSEASNSQYETIRLAIRVSLAHPKVTNPGDWLCNLELTAELPTLSEFLLVDIKLSYSQYYLVSEVAFQCYRYLRFGATLKDTRPNIEQKQILLLTILEAANLWKQDQV